MIVSGPTRVSEQIRICILMDTTDSAEVHELCGNCLTAPRAKVDVWAQPRSRGSRPPHEKN